MISLIAAVLTTLSCLLMIPSITSYDYGILDLEHREITYDRINEINKQCGFVLDSAVELQRDDNRLHSIKEELSLQNGDWWQDINGVPLLTFDDSETRKYNLRSPSNLVSFWVTGINSRYRSNKSIYISGALQIAISAYTLHPLGHFLENQRIYVQPMQSELFVGYQGIYTETEENGEERVMCLLGSTLLPSHDQSDSSLLVLRYPRKFILRSGVVRGIMKSMKNKSDHEYFDDVHMSLRLGDSANYEFASEALVSKACDPYPFKDSLVDGGIGLYKELNFCVLLKRYTQDGVFTITPNWRCNGTDDSCSKFGPFAFDAEMNARDLKLIVRDVRCEKMTFQDDSNVGTMKIHLVLRAVPPYEDEFDAVWRTGISNLTISAEGIWKSSSGQLCMVGCYGDDYKCDVRICFYLPLSISINQQALILGTLTSTDRTSISHFDPLQFERKFGARMASPAVIWDEEYIHPHPIYEYSKLDDALVIREKDKPFSLGSVMKKSLFGFPKIKDLQQFPNSLSVLENDLLFPLDSPSEDDVVLEIDFIGPLFGRCSSRQSISSFAKGKRHYFDIERYTNKHLLLNVSGQLHVPSLHSNFTFLSVEGFYDQLVGKMYLVGCQDSSDCLVEVVISYPPTTVRWLFNLEAWISVTSKRVKDDPFYFRPIKLQSGPLSYNQGSQDILSRRGLEVILSVFTLSLGITCVLGQLLYVKDNVESAHYVSLVMLGVQALGYSLPLTTGAQVISRKVESRNDWETSQWIRISDYIVKLLVLAAVLLTMRLFHKVWRSRVRMLRRPLLDPERVPNEKKVYLATLVMHSIGCILYLCLHSTNGTSVSPQSAQFYESGTESNRMVQLVGEVEEYLVLVQDLFLLPQIIANLLWRIDSKPLGKFYYFGMTFVRLVPQIYYIVDRGYLVERYALFGPQFDFFYMFGNIAMPVTTVFLGFVIYVQQRWSYEILTEAFIGDCSKFKSV